MAIYCHGCSSLFHENGLLKRLIAELFVMHGKQPCIKTSNGSPMVMGEAKERRIKKILKELRECGCEIGTEAR